VCMWVNEIKCYSKTDKVWPNIKHVYSIAGLGVGESQGDEDSGCTKILSEKTAPMLFNEKR
jgi:hypothetical protein